MTALRWHRRGDHPVDTHVLLHHGRQRPDWLEQCLASLEDEPTNVLLVDSASTNVGGLRARALVEGTAPFVSFVDDDDFVLPGAFSECLRAIDSPGIVGAYTDFHGIDARTGEILRTTSKPAWSPLAQLTHPYLVLHLHVWRRRAMTPAMLAEVAEWDTAEEALLMGLLAATGTWRKVDFIGYVKRRHNDGAGSRITRPMEVKITQRLAPILLPPPRRPARPVAMKAAPRTAPTCGFCRGVRRVLGIA